MTDEAVQTIGAVLTAPNGRDIERVYEGYLTKSGAKRQGRLLCNYRAVTSDDDDDRARFRAPHGVDVPYLKRGIVPVITHERPVRRITLHRVHDNAWHLLAKDVPYGTLLSLVERIYPHLKPQWREILEERQQRIDRKLSIVRPATTAAWPLTAESLRDMAYYAFYELCVGLVRAARAAIGARRLPGMVQHARLGHTLAHLCTLRTLVLNPMDLAPLDELVRCDDPRDILVPDAHFDFEARVQPTYREKVPVGSIRAITSFRFALRRCRRRADVLDAMRKFAIAFQKPMLIYDVLFKVVFASGAASAATTPPEQHGRAEAADDEEEEEEEVLECSDADSSERAADDEEEVPSSKEAAAKYVTDILTELPHVVRDLAANVPYATQDDLCELLKTCAAIIGLPSIRFRNDVDAPHLALVHRNGTLAQRMEFRLDYLEGVYNRDVEGVREEARARSESTRARRQLKKRAQKREQKKLLACAPPSPPAACAAA